MLSTGHKLALGWLVGLLGTLSGRIWESIFEELCNLVCTLGISSFLKFLFNEKPIFEVPGGLDVEPGRVILHMVSRLAGLLP